MNRTPPELDKIVDVVLAYRPPAKKKRLATKANKATKTKKAKSSPDDYKQ